ncbi:MAG: hypothetical protein HYZ47_04805, partial [Simkania negevensis]|nr:hypothetical protein [Simkania negevensis]
MFGQTFVVFDLPRLFLLIFIEGILSVDNALAIALITRFLTEKQRKKALFIGILSGIFLRSLAIFSISYLLHLFWIQCLGGLYLLYLTFSFFRKREGKKQIHFEERSFFHTLLLIEWTDLVFAIDSILAGLALISIPLQPKELPPKIWIVYVGGIVGLMLMRATAFSITSLLGRFPRLNLSAHLLIGWIGLKLIIEGGIRTFISPLISLP